jgi:hypothetical protein
MPRGAKPGERRGGRAKGTPNKTLLQRAQELQAKVGLKIEYLPPLEPHDGPLAKDILDRVMQYAARWAAVYRPALPGEPENEHEDEATYLKWAKVVIEAARLLIPYQSPRFRPIAVTDCRGPGQQSAAQRPEPGRAPCPVDPRCDRRDQPSHGQNPEEHLAQLILGAIAEINPVTNPAPAAPEEPAKEPTREEPQIR